jgi:hypothetical protein
MGKTAAQIVPLKTQLASSVSMLRFADSSDVNTTSSFWTSFNLPGSSGGGAVFEERIYDTSGTAISVAAPQVNAVVTGLSGAPALTTPTVNTTGGSLTGACTMYTIVPVDLSNKAGRPYYNFAQFNNNGGSNQVSVTVNCAGMTNVNKWVVLKETFFPNGGSSVFMFQSTTSVSAVTSWGFTDNYAHSAGNQPGFTTITSWSSSNGSRSWANPDVGSTVTGSFSVSFNTSSTGGNAYGHQMPLQICAYNNVGVTNSSSAQWVFVPYVDRVTTGPTPTATADTTGGSLAAGTYYYKVSAVSARGESPAGSEASATLAATGEITVSWSALSGATSYNIYRGSASGSETLIGSTTNLTWVDQGASTPNATIPVNSPVGGFGPLNTNSVSLSWPAVTGATGYRIWTGQFNGASWYVQNGYAIPTLAAPATSYTFQGNESNSSVSANSANNTGGNILRVGRGFTADGAYTVTKIGMTFQPVTGKNYRCFVIHSGQSNTTTTSSWQTATNSSLQYMEFSMSTSSPNIGQGEYVIVGVEGQDGSCVIGMPTTNASTTLDYYGNMGNDNGTYVATGGIGNYQYIDNQWGADSSSYLTKTVATLYAPIKVVRRYQNTGSQLTTQGTLLGLTSKSNEYMWSQNYSFTNSVKSIVPQWFQVNGYTNQVAVEVSSDAGNTWSALTNNTRFTFASPTKQIMYRFTLLGNTQTWTMLPGAGNLPSNGSWLNPGGGSYYYSNYGFTMDTGQSVYYSNNRAYNYNMDQSTNLGVFLDANGYNYREALAVQQMGVADVDISVTVDTLQNKAGGFGGVFTRGSGVASNYGYFLSLNLSGTVSLYSMNNQSYTALPTPLSTVPTNLTGSAHRLRLVASGSHLMGFVDGQLFISVNDSTYFQNSYWSGVAGSGITVRDLSIQSASTTIAPAAEIESFTAYLEY